MDINYEKAFKKLVEQIKLETKWAEEEYKREYPEGLRIPTQKSTRGCTVNQFWIEMSIFGLERYDKGAIAAYRSIEELAIKLENGTFL